MVAKLIAVIAKDKVTEISCIINEFDKNLPVNLVAVLGAYGFFENKPDALQGYYIEDSKQQALF